MDIKIHFLQVCGSGSSKCRADRQVWGWDEGDVDAEVGGGEHEVEPGQVQQRPGGGGEGAAATAGWDLRRMVIVDTVLVMALA